MAKELVRNYLVEARWLKEGYMPTVEEYMSVSMVTGTYGLMIARSYVGRGDIVTEDTFKWEEQERDHVASSIECYSKESGATDEEACEYISRKVKDAWKAKELVHNYLVEARWLKEGYMPTVEEYMSVSMVTGTYGLMIARSYVGRGDIVTEYTFKWVSSRNRRETMLLEAANAILRKAVQRRRKLVNISLEKLKMHGKL
nr:E-beta-farnesene synthase 2 [Tanacetum cinerariifolium]